MRIEFAKSGSVSFSKSMVDELGRVMMRPTDLGYVKTGVVDIARIPFIPLGLKFAENLFYSSDTLRTVIRSIVWETFRNGLYIEPKFQFKCKKCGATYDEPVGHCDVCGNRDFREPSRKERERVEKWVEKANINEQSLIEVLQDIDFDLNIFDNAYVVVRKKYFYDDDGKIIGAEPIEVIRGDVHNIRIVMSGDGRYGYTPDGDSLVMFCPEHRDRMHMISPKEYAEKNGVIKCPICGRQMLLAYAEYNKHSRKMFLGPGEVLHVKKFTHGIGYGYPMPLTLAMKILILMKMDYYVLMSYHIQRPPKGILILRANRDAVAKAWQFLEEATRTNPWRIVPLVIEGTERVGARRVAEWIDMSLKIDETTLMSYRDELRRSIGAAYGVMPLFQGDMSVGAGLANQGLQITVTNRAVEQEQRIFNDKVIPWIMKQLGVSDWAVRLKPHEEKDLTAQLQRELMRIQKAQQLIQLGYKVSLKEGPDGIDFEVEGLDINVEFMIRLKQWLEENGMKMTDKEVIELIQLANMLGGVAQVKAYLKDVLQKQQMAQISQMLGGLGSGIAGVQTGGEQASVGAQPQGGEGGEKGGKLSQLLDELFSSATKPKEQRFEGEPERANEKLYGKESLGYEGQPEMNRENMPGMEGQKINTKNRFEGQSEK